MSHLTNSGYRTMPERFQVKRRDFLKLSAASAGLILGSPTLWAQDAQKPQPPTKPKTNIDVVLKISRTKYSLPGPFPGKVVQVHHAGAMTDQKINAEIVQQMVEAGIQKLTGLNLNKSFKLFFEKDDVVGIKVNPVGPGLISSCCKKRNLMKRCHSCECRNLRLN